MIPELENGVTPFARWIGSKWYKSLYDLSVESGVPYTVIMREITGKDIPEEWKERLTKFLDSL